MKEVQPGMLIEKRYRIERKLGAGGFATVYAAHHEEALAAWFASGSDHSLGF